MAVDRGLDATSLHPNGSAAPPHAAPADEVLDLLDSGIDGLSTAEAERRLAIWGPNVIPRGRPPGVLKVFARQFMSPLVYVLLFAAGLSLVLRELADAGFIAAVLLLNAVIGAVEEYQAERGVDALRSMIHTTTEVLRDGERVEVDATEITSGDVVLLTSGDVVPADLRLMNSRDLSVDESALTGESLPVTKQPHAAVAPSAGLGDRPTMAFAGTMINSGRGRGVVTAIGAHTVVGALAGQLEAPSQTEPPLVSRMRRFTGVIGIAVAVAAAVTAVIELARGAAWHDVLLTAVALAVSAIPEGLPVALTVALAVAVRRMARRNVVVRRLVAIETLGACTRLATDKTGTLTVNQLTATALAVPGCDLWTVTGSSSEPEGALLMPKGEDEARLAAAGRLALAGVLCSDAVLARKGDTWVHHGDAVDVAFLILGHKLGLTREQALKARPLLDAEPFESERRYAATLHAVDDHHAELIVKGAVEQVVEMASRAAGLHDTRAIDPAAVLATADRLADTGHRVLAVATRTVRRPPEDCLDPDLFHGMTVLGLVGMIDPPRPEASTAISTLQQAGIDVVMVTGDHPATATAVARSVDLTPTTEALRVVTGTDLAAAEAAGEDALDRLTAETEVFARVEPAQKLTIVQSFVRQGHVVAVTGDGVNDAPALHHAHVGLAMGATGTDVAREAADVVVTDDRLSSIAAGVEEGRVAYANVRKVVQLLITTGAGELVLILGALAAGLPLPLLAVQLLWLNLVTNGIQDIALAFEPAEGDEMRRRPRDPSAPDPRPADDRTCPALGRDHRRRHDRRLPVAAGGRLGGRRGPQPRHPAHGPVRERAGPQHPFGTGLDLLPVPAPQPAAHRRHHRRTVAAHRRPLPAGHAVRPRPRPRVAAPVAPARRALPDAADRRRAAQDLVAGQDPADSGSGFDSGSVTP